MLDKDLEDKQERALAVFGGDARHGGDVWGWSRHLGRPVSELLDLSASLNPLGPPAGLNEVVAEAMGLVCHYPDRLAYELREALAAKLGVPASCALPGNGSTALIRMIARAFDLSNIVIFAPAFGEMARSMAVAGRHFHYLRTSEADGFAPTTELVDQLWALEPSAVILSNPTTPAGGLVDTALLDKLAKQCEQRRVWLVVDEAFIDFAGPEARAWAPKAIAEHRHLVVLRSLTKFYCIAGLRLGYALAHADTLADFAPLGQPWSVNTLAQAAGVFCLDQEGYEEQTRRSVDRWRGEQSALLEDMGLAPMPSAVNYLLCRLPAGGPTASQVAAATAREGVLLRDASSFVGCEERHLRVAVCTSEEQQRLQEVLKKAL